MIRAIIITVLVVQSLTALWGGWSLMADPSGMLLSMPTAWLRSWGFRDYVIPGVILFTIIGCGSFVTAAIVIRRHAAARLLVSLQGAAMISWITAQFILVEGLHALQFVYLSVGVFLLITARRC
jgi:hypothetical protein